MGIKSIEKLKYWTHKILPLVYDDSLSYYEILAKVTSAINNLIANDEEQTDTIETLISNVSSLDTRVTEAESKVDELETLVGGYEERISKNEEDIATNIGRISEIQEQIDEEIDRLDAKFTNPDSFSSGKQANYVLAVNSAGTGLSWKSVDSLQTGVPTGGGKNQILRKKSGNDFDTEWGNENSVPQGGTLGQVLAKSSNQDYDVAWATVTEEGVLPVNRLIPTGGTAGQTMVKKSNTNFDLEWGTIQTLPEGGVAGDVLIKQSDDDGDADWVAPVSMAIEGSTDLITSGGVYDELETMEALIDTKITAPSDMSAGQLLAKSSNGFVGQTVDTTPTSGSANPVQSGGTKSAIDTVDGKTVTNANNISALGARVGTVEGKVLPSGGSTGQFLVKSALASYNVGWADVHQMPSGGSTNQMLVKNSNNNYDTKWVNQPQAGVQWTLLSTFTNPNVTAGSTSQIGTFNIPNSNINAFKIEASGNFADNSQGMEILFSGITAPRTITRINTVGSGATSVNSSSIHLSIGNSSSGAREIIALTPTFGTVTIPSNGNVNVSIKSPYSNREARLTGYIKIYGTSL